MAETISTLPDLHAKCLPPAMSLPGSGTRLTIRAFARPVCASSIRSIPRCSFNPAALSVGADPGENQEVRVVKLQNQLLVGRQIKHLGLLGSVRVLRIERGDVALVPEMTTVLQANDTLTLSGENSEVDACARLFARRW